MHFKTHGNFEDWEDQLEEFGDFHDELCPCVQEEPDECDCDMGGLKPFMRQVLWYKRQKLLNDLETAIEGLKFVEPMKWDSEARLVNGTLDKVIRLLRGQEGEV